MSRPYLDWQGQSRSGNGAAILPCHPPEWTNMTLDPPPCFALPKSEPQSAGQESPSPPHASLEVNVPGQKGPKVNAKSGRLLNIPFSLSAVSGKQRKWYAKNMAGRLHVASFLHPLVRDRAMAFPHLVS